MALYNSLQLRETDAANIGFQIREIEFKMVKFGFMWNYVGLVSYHI